VDLKSTRRTCNFNQGQRNQFEFTSRAAGIIDQVVLFPVKLITVAMADYRSQNQGKTVPIVALAVSGLIFGVGAFVVVPRLCPPKNAATVPPHVKRVATLNQTTGPRFYTGLLVGFNEEQVPMTVADLKAYYTTQIADNVPLFVSSIFPGSPASKSDLRIGDRIVTVDGESLNGLTILEVNAMLEGKANSKVSICIRRGIQANKTFQLARVLPVNPAPSGKATSQTRNKKAPARRGHHSTGRA
jgi:hypothetical protein